MTDRVLYHGTGKDYAEPKRNDLGILWLADNPLVAIEYALPHYRKTGFLWTVRLKAGAKILDLTDLSQKPIRELFEATNVRRQHGLGIWSEKDWASSADFGILEQYQWAAKFLTQRKIDGIRVNDTLGTCDIPHPSVALLRMSAIESMERQAVSSQGPSKTIGEIQSAIGKWRRNSSVFDASDLGFDGFEMSDEPYKDSPHQAFSDLKRYDIFSVGRVRFKVFKDMGTFAKCVYKEGTAAFNGGNGVAWYVAEVVDPVAGTVGVFRARTASGDHDQDSIVRPGKAVVTGRAVE